MTARSLRVGHFDWDATPGRCYVHLWCPGDRSADAEAEVSFSVEERSVRGPLVELEIRPRLTDVASDGEDVEAWFERNKLLLAFLYGERMRNDFAMTGVHA